MSASLGNGWREQRILANRPRYRALRPQRESVRKAVFHEARFGVRFRPVAGNDRALIFWLPRGVRSFLELYRRGDVIDLVRIEDNVTVRVTMQALGFMGPNQRSGYLYLAVPLRMPPTTRSTTRSQQ